MTSLERFQNEHGQSWSELIGTPAFASALSLANSEKIQKIIALTDDEIATNGHVILADLRGHLTYEAGLLALHEKKKLVFQDLGPEEYVDPIEEALREAEHGVESFEGNREEEIKSHAALFAGGPSAHDELFPSQRKLIEADKRRSERAAKKKLPPKRKPRKIRK